MDSFKLIENWIKTYCDGEWEHSNPINQGPFPKSPLKKGQIEQIYADFEYPESISKLVRYMPMDGPDYGSLELTEKRLYKYWE
ncbi:DUF2247 family protein [Rossellomorea arthrocnemi]|uniref:DUF2247 family protein n=1 Tax=Rossellomorea arthrocnemi TaxID=2769542 RepID=UPI00191A8021|nr:DUF2247 family protein [Rossellomorea arthrocnemi]